MISRMSYFLKAILALFSMTLVDLKLEELMNFRESDCLYRIEQRKKIWKTKFMRYGEQHPVLARELCSLFFCRYCIPMDDARPFTVAEENFFATCGTGKGL